MEMNKLNQNHKGEKGAPQRDVNAQMNETGYPAKLTFS